MQKIMPKPMNHAARNATLYHKFLKHQDHIHRLIDSSKTKQVKAFQVLNHLATVNEVGRVFSF